jgi:hypothetical protein
MKKRSTGRMVALVALVGGLLPIAFAAQEAKATDCLPSTKINIVPISPARTPGGSTKVIAQVTVGGAPSSVESIGFTTDGDATFVPPTVGPPSNGPSQTPPRGNGDYVTTATVGSQTTPQHITATVLPGGAATAGCSSTAQLSVFGNPANVTVDVVPAAIPSNPGASDPNTATVTAHVTDANGNKVPGEDVTFSAPQSPTPNAVQFGGPNDGSFPAATETVTTDADGVASATANGDKSTIGQIRINATTTTGSVVGIGTLTQYGPPKNTAAGISPSTFPADGSSFATATATVTDAAGDPVPGATVTFSVNDNGIVLDKPSSQTNAQGAATTKVTSSKSPGAKTLFAFVNKGGQNKQVPFTLTQPPGTTALTLEPATIPADGTTTSTATASVLDGTGAGKAGVTITFSTNGDASIAPTTAVTGSDGKAVTTIKASTTADDETITAAGSNGQAGSAILRETPPAGHGYWFVASDGGIFNYGNSGFFGSEGATKLPAPIVGMAATSDKKGYWLVGADGSVYAHGDASFLGSLTGKKLNKPVVGMTAATDGNGYWLVASDGGVFAYGDAKFLGSAGGAPLNKPVVGMTAATDGNGYWLVASDGGVFNYGGSAPFHGSAGSIKLNKPVVGMAAATDGSGYWLVASDGGIFSYPSTLAFHGSMGGKPLNQPIVGMAVAGDNTGYWLVATDGGIFAFDVPFLGSTGATKLNKPINGMAGF